MCALVDSTGHVFVGMNLNGGAGYD